MTRRQKIRRRKRLFVGCEGESEQGYAALLQRFADEQGIAVHAEAKVIARAGDPLSLVQRTVELVAQGERGSKPAYSARFLMFDTDLLGQNPARDAQIQGLVDRNGLVLLRQDCCFEAFLLRHFNGHENDNPANAALALTRLKAVWSQYKKGLPAQDLRERLSFQDVQRAAQNHRNADFLQLLQALGIAP